MDLRKGRKKLRKKQSGNSKARMHVYRSPERNAPFENWERITQNPIAEGDFTDEDAKRRAVFYYYKMTRIAPDGTESEPLDSNTYVENGKRIERTPENSIMGSYLYWTTDPDLPPDEWTKIDELVTDDNASFQSPVKEDFYVYSVSVNFRGEPIRRTDAMKVIYKGK